MKAVIFLLSLILAISQTSPSGQVGDREREGFKGQAKRVFVGWTPLSEGWAAGVGARCRREAQEFDPQGRLTLRVLYTNVCGSEEIREYYSFDEDGSALERRDTSQASGFKLPSDPSPSANGRGRGDSYSAKHAFKYDARGRKVEAAVTKPNGELLYKLLYAYDSQGRWTGRETRGSDGKLQGRTVITYEGEGAFPTAALYFSSDGKPYSKTIYSDYRANARGDWIERKETTEALDYPKRPKTVALVYRTIDYY